MDSERAVDPISWLTDVVRLEMVLWDRVDARLRRDNEVSLAVFQALNALAGRHEQPLRVGDLAGELGITVGAASKLVDRIDAAGLLTREADPDDRRASRLVLTDAGRKRVKSASTTYRNEVGSVLAPLLTTKQQLELQRLARRIVDAEWTGTPR